MIEYTIQANQIDKSTLAMFACLANGSAYKLNISIGCYQKSGFIFKKIVTHDSDGYPFGQIARNYTVKGSLSSGTLYSAYEKTPILSMWKSVCSFQYTYREFSHSTDSGTAWNGYLVVTVPENESKKLFHNCYVDISRINNTFYQNNAFPINRIAELSGSMRRAYAGRNGFVRVSKEFIDICSNQYVNRVLFNKIGYRNLPDNDAIIGILKIINDFHCSSYYATSKPQDSHVIFGVFQGNGYSWYTNYVTKTGEITDWK